jgi:hypothetical protein
MSNSIPNREGDTSQVRNLPLSDSVIWTALNPPKPGEPAKVKWIEFKDARHPDRACRDIRERLYGGGIRISPDYSGRNSPIRCIRAVMSLLLGEAIIEETVAREKDPLLATVDIICTTLLRGLDPVQVYKEAQEPYGKYCHWRGNPLNGTEEFARRGSRKLLEFMLASPLYPLRKREELRASAAPVYSAAVSRSATDWWNNIEAPKDYNARFVCSTSSVPKSKTVTDHASASTPPQAVTRPYTKRRLSEPTDKNEINDGRDPKRKITPHTLPSVKTTQSSTTERQSRRSSLRTAHTNADVPTLPSNPATPLSIEQNPTCTSNESSKSINMSVPSDVFGTIPLLYPLIQLESVSKIMDMSKQITAMAKSNLALTRELERERRRNVELSRANDSLRAFFDKTKAAMDEVENTSFDG